MREHFNLDDLDVSKIDEELLRVIDSIELIEDESMENRDKGIRGCKAVTALDDGREYEKTVLVPLGDAANPLSWEDIKNKLASCSNGILCEKEQNLLIENIHNLQNLDRIKTINLYSMKG